MRKFDIAHLLSEKYGYKSYLEICTPTTGGTYARIDEKKFTHRMRIMYNRPSNFSDGAPVDISTTKKSSENIFGDLIRQGKTFDLVFIDSLHTYDASLMDILFGLNLMNPGGAMLLHDCYPRDKAHISPDFHEGVWYGLTFAAYLDVALHSANLNYVTVDTDAGCGIISRDRDLGQISDNRLTPELKEQWHGLDISAKYGLLEKHGPQLLQLVSADDFRIRLLSAPDQIQTSERVSQPNASTAGPKGTPGDFSENVELELRNTKIHLEILQNELQDLKKELSKIKSTSFWKIRTYIASKPLFVRIYKSLFMRKR